MLLHSVIQTVRRHNLFVSGQHLLVGVSGGADSVALLAVLRKLAPAWKLRLTVAHLDHGIRGPAAAADAAFVADLARRWNFKFVVGRVNVPARARRRGISLEMAGRSARYAFFAKVARALHCDAVATAHTADDQAETILLNLARGAGAAGLAGIPYIGWHHVEISDPGGAKARAQSSGHGDLKVVRPLRDVRRATIERFLAQNHLAWREDATNADPVFLRNRVRNEVLPFLEKRLNPEIRPALLRVSEILAAENEWLHALAKEIFGQCREAVSEGALNAKQLSGFPVAARRRVLRLWLEDCGLGAEAPSFEAIERLDNLVTERRGGRVAPLAGGWLVRRQGDKLALATDKPAGVGGAACKKCSRARKGVNSVGVHGIAATAAKKAVRSMGADLRDASVRSFAVRLIVPGETRLPGQAGRLRAFVGPGIVKRRALVIGALPAQASLSLRAWRQRRLVARSWKPGDRMRPLGMQGTKKLQDIFSDAKVPPNLRHAIPVIECGGEIVWIPGFRIAQGWAVHPSDPVALQLTVRP